MSICLLPVLRCKEKVDKDIICLHAHLAAARVYPESRCLINTCGYLVFLESSVYSAGMTSLDPRKSGWSQTRWRCPGC